jgi:Methyltransferase domain
VRSPMRYSAMSTVRSKPLQHPAVHAYRMLADGVATTRFLARHPRELKHVPRWLRERTAATMALRSPWWPYDAVAWVGDALPARPRVFEYGGGGSTLWLEDRGGVVTVVEHDEQWHAQLATHLSPAVTLLFQPPAVGGAVNSASESGYFDDYVAAIDGEPNESLDLVIVDGRARVDCARHAMPKVKPGGLLLFDDTNRLRYQPAIEALAEWERRIFAGLKPRSVLPAQTSVWRRPVDG